MAISLQPDTATVTVAQGTLRGRRGGGVAAFLGVPFAAAPTGPRRMRAPQPHPGWDGVRDAVAFGPTATRADYIPQYVGLFPEPIIPGDECLNLNVWTPDPGAAGLPVFVWFHGGAFTNGSNAVSAYDGTAFARDGVVLVSANYRLGAEGFLYTGPEMANLGLLDQIAALEWVRDNIAAFGGDPGRVTIGGESAGAMSVVTLLATPRAAGLFQRAVAQSGAATNTLAPESALLVSRHLAEAVGVAPTREGFADVDPDELVTASRALLNEVQTAGDPAKWGALVQSLLPFAPVVDGDIVPAHPLGALRTDVPLLIGTNLEEARLMLVASGGIDLIDEETLHAATAGYGPPAEHAVAVYRAARPGASPGDLLAAVVTDWFFRVPAVRVSEARAGAAAPTWMYRFDWRSPTYDGRFGAAHGVEFPFVFDTIGAPDLTRLIGPNPPQAVADTTHAAWVRFITGGEPGWAPYDTTVRATGVIGEDGTLTVVDDPDGTELHLWEGHR
ncbi:carboxylesterase family protein [Dactylosporangium sp. AC04546]|uniref:carboxylesterase/lipase family protein n=1 Tax=Dactylosporangium sp. AC04546 TaxID=2862460 RepID=UPI001EDCFAAB|nr:carboxylesterase family protein [Dactylosporangium sp. AC04546]WVK88675.1 carboxylesterase family protein [Dactylosporangium sp. AC04546]